METNGVFGAGVVVAGTGGSGAAVKVPMVVGLCILAAAAGSTPLTTSVFREISDPRAIGVALSMSNFLVYLLTTIAGLGAGFLMDVVGGDAIRRFRTGSDLGTVEPPTFEELLEGVSGGGSVIAKFTTGQPFLAEKQLGRGTVCISAMPFDLDSGIVAKRGFVPLMHELAYHLASQIVEQSRWFEESHTQTVKTMQLSHT